ncbi:MAG: class I tRNA ligase family protein [Candidatus Nealsonbacteria bacterium]|nr:class I tRNA ligase family protein [Candidatus Nealsonbacteria bacterium]
MELNFPKLEEKILKYWKENKTFEKSLAQRKRARDFVFYEGPPTANAKPGIHHVLARAFKDIICRYKTMQGFRVLRKAGWDTHGLPVEIEIEKRLGLKNKKDIEKYGVAKFNEECRKSVFAYKADWEKLTERIGFWLDMANPYITYDNDYIETVWQILKNVWEKNLLYEDYKVVPYCPRCGTGLSSHEVAQGYKKVREPAIYLKFKIDHPAPFWKDTYFLVWTTTPWTLPGNAAIAVNPNLTYVRVKFNNEYLVLAKNRMKSVGVEGEIIREFNGKTILGLRYEPLFAKTRPKQKAYLVVAGDFVSLEEGTGLVHIAPAFGEDDMRVGKKNNLPVLVTVDEAGLFKAEVKPWAGMFVKDADHLIVDDLKTRGLLFKEELYEHDYPFCWRCSSPLLYYAKKSWFINVSKIKKELLGNNQKINWIPSHLKEGRFGEWLSGVKDWALSRERFWGTPLPIWQCKKCKNYEVIGAKKDIARQKFSANRYYILRHGESDCYKEHLSSCWPEKFPCPLTKKGERNTKKVAKKIKGKIDLIFSSDLQRTKQTADIIGEELGIRPVFDERLREFNTGLLNGRPIPEMGKFWDPEGKLSRADYFLRRFEVRAPEGESWTDLKARVYQFLKDTDKKYNDKRILIVSHEAPLTMIEGAVSGMSKKEIVQQKINKSIEVSELRSLDFKNWPYDEDGDLNFHKPFIDEVKFYCKNCRFLMERVPEVIDVWFDAGSMPFAQAHWMGGRRPVLFPADYIAEAVDQTRGWFYTLLSISVLLGFGSPYKNVISLGHVLDEKGEKMSKSKGNTVDPWNVVEKYGADAARWYFYTVNSPGDPKLFSEKEVDQSLKKFIMTFWNSFVFYQTYAGEKKTEQYYKTFRKLSLYNLGPLDNWIISKLHSLIRNVAKYLDNYEITLAAREIENFTLEDLSKWYIRRSRRRLQAMEGKKEFERSSRVLGYVLFELALLSSPFIPFLAEEIHTGLVKNQKSVHLSDWPKANPRFIKTMLNQQMEEIRQIVEKGLKARMEAGIKVRQPLQKLKIKKLRADKRLLDLIKDELNVKEVVFDPKIKEDVDLDTKITHELKEEGIIREIIRYIQEMRKKAGCKPRHRVLAVYSGEGDLNGILDKNKKFILKQIRAEDFVAGKKPKQVFSAKGGPAGGWDAEEEIKVDGNNLWLAIKKL